MDIRDAMGLLQMRREEVIDAIEKGVALPSGTVVRLEGARLETSGRERQFDITEVAIEAFLAIFEAEEPGRHPPAAVRRELLVEARHKCGICSLEAPVYEFHHIIEFARLKHHDPHHMIVLCGLCHDKCGKGIIDQKAQREYKANLLKVRSNHKEDPLFGEDGPLRFSWDDLKKVIEALRELGGEQDSEGGSRFDFSVIELEEKNRLNTLGVDYFRMMIEHHEPHFHRIDEFLKDPINSATTNLYHELVDELRSQIAAGAHNFASFERLLNHIRLTAVEMDNEAFRGNRKLLNVVLSYMYFNCDIGRKG